MRGSFNPAVTDDPDVRRHQHVRARPPAQSRGAPDAIPVVGWIGSPTTGAYIRSLTNVLRRVRERHPFVLRVSGAGEPLDDCRASPVENEPWSLDRRGRAVQHLRRRRLSAGRRRVVEGQVRLQGDRVHGLRRAGGRVGGRRQSRHHPGRRQRLSRIDTRTSGSRSSVACSPMPRCGAASRRRAARPSRSGYSLRVNAPKLAATLRAVAERGASHGADDRRSRKDDDEEFRDDRRGRVTSRRGT